MLYQLFLFLTVGLFILSAVFDFFRLRIPNIIPILIIFFFFAAYSSTVWNDTTIFQSFTSHLMAGIIVFIVMLILFFTNVMGGGDAKLLPAIALWTGMAGLPDFMFITIMAGFPLALIALLLKNTKIGHRFTVKISKYRFFSYGWIKALANGQNVVPYGIAIAVGGIASFRTLGYLP
tara:strand:+ start:824 stop:1354 length:531 start_codon:yes stop_codon:yes gene_type:complete